MAAYNAGMTTTQNTMTKDIKRLLQEADDRIHREMTWIMSCLACRQVTRFRLSERLYRAAVDAFRAWLSAEYTDFERKQRALVRLRLLYTRF